MHEIDENINRYVSKILSMNYNNSSTMSICRIKFSIHDKIAKYLEDEFRAGKLQAIELKQFSMISGMIVQCQRMVIDSMAIFGQLYHFI